ncbi:proline-rich transmembrane protein 1-like isoform X1 [Octopus vulgaris]|uniref:Proline-rich transmembrane protein 1-like isoform X1 n=1 Tax=Octopus vulgaris TaxID=6645 RepID=A0AA36ANF6_OCTVU|nr:proline-rich transmembrane protein 1-like isoform X1 [Octopus vulgaris]
MCLNKQPEFTDIEDIGGVGMTEIPLHSPPDYTKSIAPSAPEYTATEHQGTETPQVELPQIGVLRITTQQPQTTYAENKMVAAILVTFFCFFPTGIPAIIYADKANSMFRCGNATGAALANKNATLFIKISIIIGIITCIVCTAAIIAAIVAATPRHVARSYDYEDYVIN